MKQSTMQDIERLLCREADELAKRRELNATDLENVYKIVESIKALKKIECMDEEKEYGGRSYDDGRSNTGGRSYDGNRSYDYDSDSSGRRRRDSMGRYSSDWNMDGTYRARGGHGNQSWDGARDRMMEQLNEMEGMATNNREREVIRRARDELKEM